MNPHNTGHHASSCVQEVNPPKRSTGRNLFHTRWSRLIPKTCKACRGFFCRVEFVSYTNKNDGDCRQLRPRRWRVLCPQAVVRHVLHLSLLLLTPRHHSRTSAVVTGRREGSCDAQLLVSPPRALASLPSPAGTGCAAGSSDACSHHNEATRLGSHRKGLLTTQDNACLCKTPVVVVVVVRTWN